MPIRQLDRAAIRREARELIRTARVSPIKFTLLFLAVSLALSLLDTALTSLTGRIVGVAFVSVSFASILIGLITQVLDAGYKCYCLGVHRREEMPYESLFDGFTFAGKVIALYIVEGFFVALWSMLFVIPGIIAVYRYSFAIWNLCQNPELGVMEALNRSKRQTIGYKGQLFGLHLSFIGWYLLAAMPSAIFNQVSGSGVGNIIFMIILSIPALFVDAYVNTAYTAFYELATEKLVVVQPGSGIDPSNVVSASYTVDGSSQPTAPVSRDIPTEGQTAQGGWGAPQETTPQTPQTEAAEMTEASQTTEAPQTGAWTAPEADATPAQEAQRTSEPRSQEDVQAAKDAAKDAKEEARYQAEERKYNDEQ